MGHLEKWIRKKIKKEDLSMISFDSQIFESNLEDIQMKKNSNTKTVLWVNWRLKILNREVSVTFQNTSSSNEICYNE